MIATFESLNPRRALAAARRAVFAFAATLLVGCALGPEPRPSSAPNAALDGAPALEEAIESARANGAKADGAAEAFGYVRSGQYRIAASVFLPAEPRATIAVTHGYEASAGAFAPLARSLAAAGFAVVALDLPGHGRSDGEPGRIGDFREYGDAVASVAAVCGRLLPSPLIALGHSAGALATLDAMARPRWGAGAAFDSAILVAPLSRTAHWGWSRAGYALVRPFAREVPDGNGGAISLAWFGRLAEWRKEAAFFDAVEVPALVIQGGRDGVVDNRDARRLYSSKLPAARFEVLPWMGHHDLERKSIDPRLAGYILGFLEERCAAVRQP
jgi:alpha-beta hydrolase superfamily lysophospholipase